MGEGSVPSRTESPTTTAAFFWCECTIQAAPMLPHNFQPLVCRWDTDSKVEKEPPFSCQRSQDSGLPHLVSLCSPLQWLQVLFLCSWEFSFSSLQGLNEDASYLFNLPDAGQPTDLLSWLGDIVSQLTHNSSRSGHFLCLPQPSGELSWQLETWRAASFPELCLNEGLCAGVVFSADALLLVWAFEHGLQQGLSRFMDCTLAVVVA